MLPVVAILASRPLWAVAIQSALITVCLTLLASVALSRRKRRRKRCRTCGHDLTGNASAWCPNCGTPVPPKHAGEEDR